MGSANSFPPPAPKLQLIRRRTFSGLADFFFVSSRSRGEMFSSLFSERESHLALPRSLSLPLRCSRPHGPREPRRRGRSSARCPSGDADTGETLCLCRRSIAGKDKFQVFVNDPDLPVRSTSSSPAAGSPPPPPRLPILPPLELPISWSGGRRRRTGGICRRCTARLFFQALPSSSSRSSGSTASWGLRPA